MGQSSFIFTKQPQKTCTKPTAEKKNLKEVCIKTLHFVSRATGSYRVLDYTAIIMPDTGWRRQKVKRYVAPPACAVSWPAWAGAAAEAGPTFQMAIFLFLCLNNITTWWDRESLVLFQFYIIWSVSSKKSLQSSHYSVLFEEIAENNIHQKYNNKNTHFSKPIPESFNFNCRDKL